MALKIRSTVNLGCGGGGGIRSGLVNGVVSTGALSSEFTLLLFVLVGELLLVRLLVIADTIGISGIGEVPLSTLLVAVATQALFIARIGCSSVCPGATGSVPFFSCLVRSAVGGVAYPFVKSDPIVRK